MTSFGGNIVGENGYMTTFKVQGHVYQRIGSLLLTVGQDSQFLQLYILGDDINQAQRRVSISEAIRPRLIFDLQKMLQEQNYVRSFDG